MGKRMGNALNVWTPIRSAADLPTVSGDYLVTICEGPMAAPTARYVRTAFFYTSIVSWEDTEARILPEFAWNDAGWRRVTAWRPMPKPYKGEA